jgi:hypothetical protein
MLDAVVPPAPPVESDPAPPPAARIVVEVDHHELLPAFPVVEVAAAPPVPSK